MSSISFSLVYFRIIFVFHLINFVNDQATMNGDVLHVRLPPLFRSQFGEYGRLEGDTVGSTVARWENSIPSGRIDQEEIL